MMRPDLPSPPVAENRRRGGCLRTIGCLIAVAIGGFAVTVAPAVAQSTGLERYLPVVAVVLIVVGFFGWIELGIRFGEPRQTRRGGFPYTIGPVAHGLRRPPRAADGVTSGLTVRP